ncbi:hypothetical protein K490DRAFT_54014 [Saccharata proteae CBS 121410]|uniref:Uncharacterized protein n=1 Tax=Saccharata proteae CBS 121410 TaxID=1314787 RepID=A0A9P4I0A1_9PEZI|nr:hypothetical protein K490DRAFT_54014 [Saccharata proteae CBS 121410]
MREQIRRLAAMLPDNETDRSPSDEEGLILQDFNHDAATAMAQDPTSDEWKQARSEWIPVMLQKRSAIFIFLYCLLFSLGLEILNVYIKGRSGLAAHSDQNILNAVIYIPTVAAVILGFAWRPLNGSIKRVYPWSTMSTGKWVKGSDSVFLDYITTSEAVSLVQSTRRKHWPVTISIFMGVLCGVLVTLTNSLTKLHTHSISYRKANFTLETEFDYERLQTTPNGTLKIPTDHLVAQPYAAVKAQRMPNAGINGGFAPWTQDGYAFGSFGSENYSAYPQDGGTVVKVAATPAFFSNFTCDAVKYQYNTTARPVPWIGQTVWYSPDHHQPANSTDSCPTQARFEDPGRDYMASLSLSHCDQHPDSDLLLVNIYRRLNGSAEVHGLVCSPGLFEVLSEVMVDVSTNTVIDYHQKWSNPRPIEAEISVAALWTYLMSPLPQSTQTDSETMIGDEDYTGSSFANFGNITEGLPYINFGGKIDPFFSLLANEDIVTSINSWMDDPRLFMRDFQVLSSNILAQVVNAWARVDVKDKQDLLSGSLVDSSDRIFFGQNRLRFAQALVLVIGSSALCLATLLRPKTRLLEDPGPIAATAIVMAASDTKVEELFGKHATSAESEMSRNMKSTVWRLQTSAEDGRLALECQLDHADASGTLKDPPTSTAGWLPLSLTLPVKILLGIQMLASIVVLAYLFGRQSPSQGLWASNSTSSQNISLVATTILVILGYLCWGVDGAIRSMAPYKSLVRRSGNQPLLYNLSDMPSIWAPIARFKSGAGVAVFASSIAIILVPILKIAAAGLYPSVNSEFQQGTTVIVDSSLILLLEKIAADPNLEVIAHSAIQDVEWTRIPSFNMSFRSGMLDNLVFANVTDVEALPSDYDLYNATLRTQVPAISVDVLCDTDICAKNFPASIWIDDQKDLELPRMPHFADAYSGNNDSCGQVTVNTTFTRSPKSGLAWRAESYDPSTIQFVESYYQGVLPKGLLPPSTYKERFNDSSIWPARSEESFFELLATFAQYQLENLTAYDDQWTFKKAVEAMMTAYAVEMLSEMRPFALDKAHTTYDLTPQPQDGILNYYKHSLQCSAAFFGSLSAFPSDLSPNLETGVRNGLLEVTGSDKSTQEADVADQGIPNEGILTRRQSWW